MASAVEADLSQLDVLFALHRRMDPAIDTREIAVEIGERVREELDYLREAKHAALYARILRDHDEVRVPAILPELSTKRLLTLDWLDGRKLLLHPSTGGGTDAGYATQSGHAAVLESLGLPGWGYHARNEYIEIDAIVPRLYLSARMLQDLAKNPAR